MKNQIITAPSVYAVAAPTFLLAGLEQFIAENGLEDVAANDETPLGRLTGEVYDNAGKNGAEELIEFAGRQCYRSWRAGRAKQEYLENILETKHGSVVAHAHFSFQITGVSRSLTHELIRHAAGVDISQESQRYVDAKDIAWVVPPMLLHIWGGDLGCGEAQDWIAAREAELEDYVRTQEQVRWFLETEAEKTGEAMTSAKKSTIKKRANEAARASLSNAAETRLVWTVNIRALRHILALRGDETADLEIRRFAAALADVCRGLSPILFGDVAVNDAGYDVPTVSVVHQKV